MTPEGTAVWRAGQTALRGTMGGVVVDISGALAMATAFGVPPAAAAHLIAAFRAGMLEGFAERKRKEEEPDVPV